MSTSTSTVESQPDQGREDPHDTTSEAGPRPAGRRRPRRVTVVLSAALAVTLGLTGWLLLDRHERTAVDTARREATAQARTAAVALTSYDHETLEKDFDAVRELAVEPFAGQFDKASATLTEVLEKYQGAAQGKVVRTAVSSADEDRVEVLLFVDQTVESSLQDKPRVDRNRVAMTMVRTDDGWRVSEADLL